MDFAPVGVALDEFYEAPKFYDFMNLTNDDPLAALVPLVGMEKCFGTFVQNIFIVQRPYGWSNASGGTTGTYSWPPPGYEDSKARLIEAFKYFASYETKVWMDFTFDCESCEEGTAYCDMLEQTEEGIIEMCDELADYGFEYMGRIETEVDAEFFKPYINPHLNGEDAPPVVRRGLGVP